MSDFIRVGLVNTYMQGRETQIPSGHYPSHHLWGADKLNQDRFQLLIVPPSGRKKINRLAKYFTSVLRSRFGDLDQEIEIWRVRKKIDILYVADGNLFWIPLLHIAGLFRPRIVRWAYIPRLLFPWWKFRNINNSLAIHKGTDLLLCLTNRAAMAHQEEMPWLNLRQVDWGADPQQFAPGERNGQFFFACGRTNRDYRSLVLQAHSINAEIHLIVNKSYLSELSLPANVHAIDGSKDLQTDRGIPYPQLIQGYFHKALALLIPLKISSHDSAGMTNLLEGMACGLPVIMTRTGSIDINIEKLGIGIYVDPDDPHGWGNACNALLSDHERARAMGDRGRQLVESHFNTERLGRDLSALFDKLHQA